MKKYLILAAIAVAFAYDVKVARRNQKKIQHLTEVLDQTADIGLYYAKLIEDNDIVLDEFDIIAMQTILTK